MAFVGIDAVTYGVTNMERATKFYADFGLKKRRTRGPDVVFETANGCEIILRPRGAKDLPPAFENGSTLRLLTWGLSSKAHLAHLRRSLGVDHDIHDLGDGAFWIVDPSGIPLAFRRAKRKPVKAEKVLVNAPQDVQRVNRRATYYDRAHPLTIGHVVFNIPSVAKAKKFYIERLGFHLTDVYRGRGIFLRCEARHGHHNLFFLESEDGTTTLNHVAFAVRNIHELFGGGQHLALSGWKTAIGPGRHHVSSCYFWYFKNPAGALSEYFWDEDFPTENWKPKQWSPDPTVFAEWVLPEGLPRAATLPPTRGERDRKKAKSKGRQRKRAVAQP